MLDNLINLVTSIQLVRQLIGGTWYSIADCNRNQVIWLRNIPSDYHVVEVEEYYDIRINKRIGRSIRTN